LKKWGKVPLSSSEAVLCLNYSREVYFTADIDLAYADREALDTVLTNIGFEKQGKYWASKGLKIAIEARHRSLWERILLLRLLI